MFVTGMFAAVIGVLGMSRGWTPALSWTFFIVALVLWTTGFLNGHPRAKPRT